MAAATRVFGTFELLENILIRVSTKDLLHSQRVGKVWKGTIDNSPVLQRALFFLPVSKRVVTFTIKPLWYEKTLYGANYLEWNLKTWVEGECTVNPLFRQLFDIMSYVDRNHEVGVVETTLSDYIAKHLPSGYSNRNASWRRMMPTQPPVDSPLFTDHIDRDVGPEFVAKRSFSYGKIVMADVIEELEYNLRRYERVASIFSIIRLAAPVLYGIGFESTRKERLRRQQQRKIVGPQPDRPVVIDGLELVGDEFDELDWSSDDGIDQIRMQRAMGH